MAATWHELYRSHAVGVYLLLVVPVVFLAVLAVRGIGRGGGVEPWAARFVRVWTVVFALVSIADPIATGLFAVPLVPFVLLGDYRVFALLLVVMRPGRPRWAALLEAGAWTLVVPAVAYGTFQALRALGRPLPDQALWLLYEAAFAMLTVFWMARVVPGHVGLERPAVRRWAERTLGVVLAYYLLWAVADVLILAGRDEGWALRIVPNLLYYGAFVPVAYGLFFAPDSVSARRSTHAAR